ncbi:N-acetyltransferase [Clostridium massiliamazoniense]|uniref:N-acetyltransferase n=1 Tax=Clostridium massiliamazoniense TaxID=1347366 RepID=UPI0006D80608|nr:N-acetyltransferase [Clostridium massiliamazoniense]
MIRKSENKDVNKIMTIWKESTIKAHDFIDKQYWEDNYETVKNTYLPISETFVYVDQDNIKGFISVIENEFIGALFIDVNYQGEGIGSKLIDYVSEKYGDLELAVYKDNEKAVKFYQEKGFKIVKEQETENPKFKEYIMKKH